MHPCRPPRIAAIVGRIASGLVLGALVQATIAPRAVAQSAPVLIGGEEDRVVALKPVRRIALIGDRILTLHDGAPYIRAFSLDGRLLQSFGRRGSGPGEFLAATTLIHDAAADELVVFDQAQGRASYLSLRDSLHLVRTRSLELSVRDGCLLGDRLFVESFSNERFVHELAVTNDRFRIKRSIGTLPTWDASLSHPVYQMYLSDGPLACDAARGVVALASRDMGVLHLIPEGRGQQTSLPILSYARLTFEIVDGTALRLKMPPTGVYDQVVAVHVEQGKLRVVLGRADLENKGAGEYSSYRDVLIAPGAPHAPQPPAPWHRVGTAQGRTVCYRGAPAPTITIVTGAACPSG